MFRNLIKKTSTRFISNSKKFSNKIITHQVFLEPYHTPFSVEQQNQLLKEVGCKSETEFTKRVIPYSEPNKAFKKEPIDINLLSQQFKEILGKNKRLSCFIGQGFYPNFIPSVIKRTVLENPKWYTAYTPYQAEISQGRLETLFNFQILVKRLTGLEIANASLLDESSAAGEAVLVAWRHFNFTKNTILVSENCFDSTIKVIKSVCQELKIKVIVGKVNEKLVKETNDLMGVVLQTPDALGVIHDLSAISSIIKQKEALTIVGTDLLACVVCKGPGEMGADIAFGNGQRFGTPMGFGGPHAAFFAGKKEFLRNIPGRVISRGKDVNGGDCYRMSLQTREQHIKREKATSNICTAQALLANLNFFYALFHGEEGLKNIANRVHSLTQLLALGLQAEGFKVKGLGSNHVEFFDTITVVTKENADSVVNKLSRFGINVWKLNENEISISLDETKTLKDVIKINQKLSGQDKKKLLSFSKNMLPLLPSISRNSPIFKEKDIFNSIKGEHELLRYVTRMENKDVSLCHSMIPLGSCTLKLNSAYQLENLSNPDADIHPFVPRDQCKGYLYFIKKLGEMLCQICHMDAISFQSNSGATGEYVGLMTIKNFHVKAGNAHRDVILIPNSAHGTNPASAAKIGLKIVQVGSLENGYVDLKDLDQKIKENKSKLCGLMMTFPSTFGVFEESAKEIIEKIHQAGGLVYIDGANMNAQLMSTSPGSIGGDVCHLNLHKTFAIPHGGGGPGIGPVLVKKKLAEFLPTHFAFDENSVVDGNLEKSHGGQISNAPFSSASILMVPFLFISAMGSQGIRRCGFQSTLSANYLGQKLSKHYPLLFSNAKGFVAHEFILDIRPIKKQTGISEEDIAKRLMDFGFHAPTMSFPIGGTLMIEPTESENLEEIERFCEALIIIRKEIDKVDKGLFDKLDNPLKNAPHTLKELLNDNWNHKYSREEAAYPIAWLRTRGKVWPSVSRIDNLSSDRNPIFE